MRLEVSHAIDLLEDARGGLTPEQIARLDRIIADKDREPTVDDALEGIQSQSVPNQGLERLKKLRDEVAKSQLARRVQETIPNIGMNEEELVRLLNESKKIADGREKWDAVLTLNIRATLRRNLTFAKACRMVRNGSFFEGRLDPFIADRKISADTQEPASVQAIQNFIRHVYGLPIRATLFAEKDDVELSTKLREIDTIIAAVNNDGISTPDLFAYLEARHECVRKMLGEGGKE